MAGCCAGANLFCINQYSSVQRDEWKIQKLDQIHPEVYVFPVELLESLFQQCVRYRSLNKQKLLGIVPGGNSLVVRAVS